MASTGSLDKAGTDPTYRMAEFLARFAGLPVNDAGMLMSLVGQLKVCQVVDPQKSALFEFQVGIEGIWLYYAGINARRK